MDDDKSLIEKTIEAVKEMATLVTEAAKHAMEPEPVKPGQQVVFMPMAGDGFADPMMSPMPMVPVVIAKKKLKAKRAPARIPAKAAAKKANNKSAKKAAKKSRKSSVKRKAAAKKTVKKVAKKRKRSGKNG